MKSKNEVRRQHSFEFTQEQKERCFERHLRDTRATKQMTSRERRIVNSSLRD